MMRLTQAVLAIADISGYTEFIRHREVSLMHAEQIIADLLSAVVEGAEHPLTLNKFEGDALLLYAEIDGNAAVVVRDVYQQAQRFFTTFRQQQARMKEMRSHCECDACANIHRLSLKAFLHVGEITIRQWRQFTELAGEPLILIHRLLKNHVPAHEYLLMTDAYVHLGGIQPGNLLEEPIAGLDTVLTHWIEAPTAR
jgi:serine phosphatase RsbU (regulator of sigma subunit)